MIFKKSIGNIFRSRTKSTLFFILILVVSSLLSVSLSTWISINNFLDECDENYKTIALFEYMGTDYPVESILDENMQAELKQFDFSIIEQNENVLHWDRSEKALGYTEDFYRTDILAPYKKGAVLIVGDMWDIYRRGSIGTVVYESLYSEIDWTGKVVMLEDMNYEWEKDHYYVIHGYYIFGRTSYQYIDLEEFENDTATSNGFLFEPVPKIIDITTEDGGYYLDEDSIYREISKTYEVINNSLMVNATSDLTSILPFHQQNLYIEEGREFTEDEYQNGEKVCIVSKFYSKYTGKGIGDKIKISYAVEENTAPYESYWSEKGFIYEDEYEIIGLTNDHRDLNHHAYIPKSDAMDFTPNQIGYTIGQAVLINGTADEFYNEVSPLLASRMRITTYDQGYAEVAEPFKDIRRLAVIVSIACIMTCLAVLALFGFSFVYRQRDVSDIMIKLGAGKGGVYRYFLYSSGILSLLAVIGGSFVAYFLSGNVIELVKKMAEGYTLSDKRYSVGNLSIVKTLEFSPELQYRLFLLLGGIVLIFALISCSIYVYQTFKVRKKNKNRIKKLRAGHTIKLRGASIKYAFASVIRGGARTMVVPLVCAVAIVFLGQLSNTADSYNVRIDEINSETIIRGHFTDIYGKLTNNVVVDSFMVKDIFNSGYTEEIFYSKALDFHYGGVSVRNGIPTGIPPIEIPDYFAGETFMDQLRMGPDIVYTNNIMATPEFFYSNGTEVTYMDGYDETFFTAEKSDQHLCVVSKTMMKEEGIEYGDSLSVYIPDFPIFPTSERFMDIKVVGSFVKQARQSNVYCQINAYFNSETLSDINTETDDVSFDAVDFKLKNAGEMEDFKTWLTEYGISEATRLDKFRSFIVIEDIKYNSTLDMLRQQIRYINVLYPFLYVLVGIVALIVSYLMVVGRRKEFAIMRGLGTGKASAFSAFFTEQLFLCIIGSGIGFIINQLLNTVINTEYIILTAGYIALYLVGSTISVLIMNSIRVSAILKYED